MNEPRVRKAWECSIKGMDGTSIVYAETQSKARYQMFLDVSESRQDLKIVHVIVRRAKHADIELPARHWLLDHLSAEQAHCVLHAFGGDSLRAGYRDYFYTSSDHMDLLKLTYEFGLFQVYREESSGICFGLTALGKSLALSMVSTYPRQ